MTDSRCQFLLNR